MFSVLTSVVLLVFFVSQGQTSSTVSPTVSPTVNVTVSPSQSSAVVSSSVTTPTLPSEKTLGQTSSTVSPSSSSVVVLSSSVSNLNSSAAPTEFTTETSEQPTTDETSERPTTSPSIKTCAKLGVVIDKPWNDTYKDSTSKHFRNLSATFSSALTSLYNDSANYTYVKVSEVQLTEEKDKVLASAKLCLVFKEGVEVFIEDVFKDKVATGKLDADLPVKKDSAEFEPLGVSFDDGKAKEGECEEKCEGAAGPFFIVRECKPEKGFSCKGHKTTKETNECTKYCPSTAVAASVSFAILMIGILLSSSFQ